MFRNLASSIGYVTCDRPGTGIIRLFIPSLDSLRRAPRAVIWLLHASVFFCILLHVLILEACPLSPSPPVRPTARHGRPSRSHGPTVEAGPDHEEAERSDQEHPEKGRLRPSRDDLPFGSEKSRLTTSGLGVCAIN